MTAAPSRLRPRLAFLPHFLGEEKALPVSPMTGPLLSSEPVHIIGAGLAGSEAAWQVAQAGVPAILHEMRPVRILS